MVNGLSRDMKCLTFVAPWVGIFLKTPVNLKRNSRKKATEALFGIEYESNLRVKA